MAIQTDYYPFSNELDNSTIHLLHRAGQFAGDIFVRNMRGMTLTPRQYAVLSTISMDEGLNQTDLVKRTGIDRSTLTDIIRRMLGKGLIKRQRMIHDARAYAVYLTDKGREQLNMAKPAAMQSDEQILSVLPEEARQEFLNALNILVENIKKTSKY